MKFRLDRDLHPVYAMVTLVVLCAATLTGCGSQEEASSEPAAVDCLQTEDHKCVDVNLSAGSGLLPLPGAIGRREGDYLVAAVGRGGGPNGCVFYGPYFRTGGTRMIALNATFEIDAEDCNPDGGGCGANFWAGYTGDRYQLSSRAGYRLPQFTIDLVARRDGGSSGSHVFGSKVITGSQTTGSPQTIHSEGVVDGNFDYIEARVCNLVNGNHREFILKKNRCVRTECEETIVQETREDLLRVKIKSIKIKGMYETAR